MRSIFVNAHNQKFDATFQRTSDFFFRAQNASFFYLPAGSGSGGACQCGL
jgi:hypothetical protein